MIVIEGPDKVGKTTLADRFYKLLPGWRRVHFGVPPDGVPVFDYHVKGLAMAGPMAIVDRLHWSEYAYGLTYRGKVGYNDLQWVAMETYLASCKATMILLTDKVSSIKARWDDPFDPGRVPELVGRFSELQMGHGEVDSIFKGCLVERLTSFVDECGNVRGNKLAQLVEFEKEKFK